MAHAVLIFRPRILMFWLSLAALLIGPHLAGAQETATEQPSASADDQILAGLEKAKRDGEGLIIVGAEVEGGISCPVASLKVGRMVQGKLQQINIPGMVKVF